MSNENPYEPQLLGYDLDDLSQSEEYELEELIENKSMSPMEFEEALQRVRLKYLTVVAAVYFFLGVSGIALFVLGMIYGPEFRFMSEIIGMYIIFFVSILLTISSVGLVIRKPWGRTIARFTSKVILLAFPFGTIFGLFALSTISSCDPEFE